jgi:hypothetical protein
VNYFKSRKFKDIAGFTAAIIFSVACLAASMYHIKFILDLKQLGLRASATVVDFERGARNSKWAIYRYVTIDDQEVIAKDKFQQYIKRVHKGESVTVIYHKEDVTTVTSDLGLWIWQAPVIFLSGFLLLSIIGFFIWRHRAT